jgi:hypothetical protein
MLSSCGGVVIFGAEGVAIALFEFSTYSPWSDLTPSTSKRKKCSNCNSTSSYCLASIGETVRMRRRASRTSSAKRGRQKKAKVEANISTSLRQKLDAVTDSMLESSIRYKKQKNFPSSGWTGAKLSRGLPGNEEEDP